MDRAFHTSLFTAGCLCFILVCSSQEKEERYLMLFSNVLVMLSASPRMSGFIYQVSTTSAVKCADTTIIPQRSLDAH